MNFAAVMFVALAIDVAVGWPKWLCTLIGHPVTWIGWVISWADKRFNNSDQDDAVRQRAGTITALAVIFGVALIAFVVQSLLPGGVPGVVLAGVLTWPLVAAKSLHDHVQAVAEPLIESDLDGARRAISIIVGRNPEALDQPGIARAALESLAENASDGVIAPLFWGCLLGLPGIAAYKAINTLDSMIGYRTPKHEAYGSAAARIDDLANLVPARLTGSLIALVSRARGTAYRTMLRDAGQHRSPNAGWPEAAMAGALGVRLSGPRVYDCKASDDPWLNSFGGDPRPEDMKLGLRLFRRSVLAAAGLLLALALV